MANAEKSKNTILLRRLIQEKGTLDRDIKKLERLLIMEKKAAHEKKVLNPYQGHMK
jgi:hypothetical protein